MTESGVDTGAATPVVAKSKKAVAAKATPKAKSSVKKAAAHPPTAQMVNNAIKNLKDRGGSSLQAIKKYISTTYKADAEKLAPFIKKHLKSSVDSGGLIRTKGKGAAGSFKLAVSKAEGSKKSKKLAAKKPKAATAPKPKKVTKPKKEGVTPKKAKATPKPKAAKPKTSGIKKSPKKVKKVKAPAAKKPKSPKPKKAAIKKVSKKPAAKK